MGSTLLEYENVSWPILYTISLDAVRRRLVEMGKTPPDVARMQSRFFEFLERRRERLRTEMREYRVAELMRSFLRSIGIKTLPGELSRLTDAYYAPIRRQVSVYPDAQATLAWLKDRGYTVGLLSNTCFRVGDHREELTGFGLWHYFDAAEFTSTGLYRKPHPEPFRTIARKLKIPLDRCLYIGDRQIEDVTGPQGVGMTAVLVRRPHRAYQEGLTDAVEIWSLNELTALVE